MSVATPAYIEMGDFIAGSNPQAIAHFRPSGEAQHRVADLLEREKGGSLSADEKAELDHFIELEHILRDGQAKVRLILAKGI